jgi:hypothetical protein
MSSPDRTPKHAPVLLTVFILGVLSPPAGIAVAGLLISWLDLEGPWPTTVLAVTTSLATALGMVVALRLDHLRRHRA